MSRNRILELEEVLEATITLKELLSCEYDIVRNVDNPIMENLDNVIQEIHTQIAYVKLTNR